MLLVVAAAVNRLKYIKHSTFVTPVKRIMLPDNFTKVNQQDIGLLKLKNALPRNSKHISVAKMPLQSPPPGLRCNVMGWGRVYQAGPMASYLLYIDVMTIDSLKCAKLLNVPTMGLLCAIDDNPVTAQQPCVGDWGSPLMHGSTVYGIVSVIVGCGDDKPSVYTDVYLNIDWINKKINTDTSSTISVPHWLIYFIIVIVQNRLFSLFIFVRQN
ncbi:trypsin alpha-3 isoform X2 [Drosophila elegans]|uniref:trypsin alpha-3 isoform X2 n=2 Tax=Drosophila elegans TaxID=30023 RepID=UPI0007E5CA9A|nr:trypsin alpha-3 isoform X2 [Drosophila elegans]XP_017121534.1 trypsin alpha-3 isoform X2 [Drosophila elegans]XP_041564055.1 trypsin alpha-3 isoform X2 [Drosophila elegans]